VEIEHSAAQDMESAVKTIIGNFDDLKRPGLIDTPARVRKVYEELLSAKEPKLTIFPAENYNEMVTDTGIKYYTFCEHHMLPFFGHVTISYIPNESIVGLSKLSRIVDYFSRRLNTQEYFTNNIADYIQNKLSPKGVGVYATGRHLCKEMRGIKSISIMETTSLRGLFKNKDVRLEFLQSIHAKEL
jgi:GTP cyclohydrolase I